MEAELAEWAQENDSRLPIVAFMAGRFMDEMPGMRFGHAGTIVEGKADTTADKIERMQAAGISVAERIEEIPALIREGRKGISRGGVGAPMALGLKKSLALRMSLTPRRA
jgi:succinyl-CoA synthetase alpha subunit